MATTSAAGQARTKRPSGAREALVLSMARRDEATEDNACVVAAIVGLDGKAYSVSMIAAGSSIVTTVNVHRVGAHRHCVRGSLTWMAVAKAARAAYQPEPAHESGERVRFALRERVAAVLGEGVVNLFEVAGTDAEVVLTLRSLDEIDALPTVRDTLDHAGFEAVSVGKVAIVVSEAA